MNQSENSQFLGTEKIGRLSRLGFLFPAYFLCSSVHSIILLTKFLSATVN